MSEPLLASKPLKTSEPTQMRKPDTVSVLFVDT